MLIALSTLTCLTLLIIAAIGFLAAAAAAAQICAAIARLADAVAALRADCRTVIYGDPHHVHLVRMDRDHGLDRASAPGPLTSTDDSAGAEGDG